MSVVYKDRACRLCSLLPIYTLVIAAPLNWNVLSKLTHLLETFCKLFIEQVFVFSKRFDMHEKAIFNGDVEWDALAEHKETCNCEIKWENVKTLSVEPVWFRRKVREALEIRRLGTGPGKPNGLNRDDGDYVTTNTWTIVFDKINSKQHLTIGTFESMTSQTIWRQSTCRMSAFFQL